MIKLIAITGRARAGKDTVSQMLEDMLPNSVTYAIASPIKRAFFAMLDVDADEHSITLSSNNKEEEIDWLGVSPRQILQELGGTIRDRLGEDFWLNFLGKFCSDIEQLEGYVKGDHAALSPLYVIVSDVRYDNEAAYIKARGGVLLKVEGDPARSENVREHESENGVSRYYVDYVIDNTGTLEELEQEVLTLVKERITK